MADAVGEEYKHFSMDLEFLLRRTPEVARDRPRRAVPARRHRRARRGRRGRPARRRGLRQRRTGATRPPERRLAGQSAACGGRGYEPSAARARADHATSGWKLIDEEARERLLPGLASRRLVDFSGPHGWEHSATNLGRVERANVSELKGVEANRRVVLPLIELRARFTVSREELRAGDRGAEDVDFAVLDAAAQRIVEAENTAVFHAWPKAGIEGITASSPHKPIVRGKSFERLSRVRRARGRAAAAQRHRRPVRARARARGLHERRRDRRARRLPAARPPAQDHQGPDRVGPGRQRCGRA